MDPLINNDIMNKLKASLTPPGSEEDQTPGEDPGAEEEIKNGLLEMVNNV